MSLSLKEKSDALRQLYILRGYIEDGTVEELLILTKCSDTNTTEVFLTASQNSHLVAGQLMELAMKRLKFAWDDR